MTGADLIFKIRGPLNPKKAQNLSIDEQDNLVVLVFRAAIVSLLFWNLAILLAPILASSSNSLLQIISGGIYFFMDPVCHQLAERSFFIYEWPMPVCVRCFTIYLSSFITMIYTMLRKRLIQWPGRIYLIMILLVGLEIGAEKLELIQNWFELRMLNGLLLGILLARLFMESIFKFPGNEKNG